MLAPFVLGVACVDPRENFVNIMSGMGGKSADDEWTRGVRSYQIHWPYNLAEWNIEEGYRGYRTCRYFFEIDKTTGRIVRWRSEGSEGCPLIHELRQSGPLGRGHKNVVCP